MKRIILFLCALLRFESGAQEYQVIGLGTLGGESSSATTINDLDQVSGWSTDNNGQRRAFEYSNGHMSDLGIGTVLSIGYGINNNGQIVGQADPVSSISYAFLYADGLTRNLGNGSTLAWGINNSGQSVGYMTIPYNYGGNQHAFVYSGSSLFDLHPQGLSINANSQALGINNNGQVVGFVSPNGDQNFQACLFENGSVHYLGTLGGSYSVAKAINNVGQIIGNSETDNHTSHAFLYSSGSMLDLGTLGDNISDGSYALGINDSGFIVGTYITPPGDHRAFLFRNREMFDLNTLINSNSGWILNEATAINAAGDIVGWGTDSSGHQEAVLLHAVPEPAVLLPFFLLALMIYKRQR